MGRLSTGLDFDLETGHDFDLVTGPESGPESGPETGFASYDWVRFFDWLRFFVRYVPFAKDDQ
jgi:hypothetical protein